MENTNKKSFGKAFLDGMYFKNPVLSMFCGLTFAVIATTRVELAFIVGIIVLIDLVLTDLVVSIFRHHLDHLSGYIVAAVLSAGFATFFGILFLNCFRFLALPNTIESQILVFEVIPFLATTSIVLEKSEADLERNVVSTLADSLGSGVGYLIYVVLLALLREVLSTGAISIVLSDGKTYGPVLFKSFSIPLLAKPFGAFLFTGIFSGIHGTIVHSIEEKRAARLQEDN